MLYGCQFTLLIATESKSFEGTRWPLLASGAVRSEYKQMPHVSLLHPSYCDGCHIDGRGSTQKIDIIPSLAQKISSYYCFCWFMGKLVCYFAEPLIQRKTYDVFLE